MTSIVEISVEVELPELDEDEIRRVLLGTLEREGARMELSLAIVDDETIHAINRRFLDHDYPTDVISFDLGDGGGLEGEVVVSADTARREALLRGTDPRGELLLYCVHGTLHLLGWDDQDDDDRARMHARQRELLAGFGYETSE